MQAGEKRCPQFEDLPRIALSELATPPATGRQFLLELPADLTLQTVRETITEIRAAHDAFNEGRIVVGLVREPLAAFSREFPDNLILCTLNVSDRDFWHTQHILLDAKNIFTRAGCARVIALQSHLRCKGVG